MSIRRTPPLFVALFLVAFAVFFATSAAQPRLARADDQFTVKGLGYGHAVGLSQWGAWAGARQGATFDQILAFYYPGTSLEQPVGNDNVTVKLSSYPWASSYTQDFTQVRLSGVDSPLTLVKYLSSGGQEQETIPLGSSVYCANNGGVMVFVTGSGASQGPYAAVEVRPEDGHRISFWFNGMEEDHARQYWGKMRIDPVKSVAKVNAFNIVPVELYLRTIAEMPGSWADQAFEALKAGIVASRSNAMTRAAAGTFINDNTKDQVYAGYTGPYSGPGETPYELRNPGIGLAAEATAGKVVRYGGVIKWCFYSSHSGGYTTDTRVWGSNPASYPYLVAKDDPWSLAAPVDNPGYSWTFTMSAATLTSKLSGLVSVGTITGVAVESRDTSSPFSHARTLRITGTGGTKVVSADSVRSRLGWGTMRSTLITSINGVGTPRSTDPDAEMWVFHRWVTDGAPGSTPTGDQGLTPTLFDTQTISTESVTVRSGPSTSAPVVTTLDPNTAVTVYAWRHAENYYGDERWYRIDKPVKRVFTGTDRYDTAIRVSKESYPGGAVPALVLAKGDDFPDALAAAPLAAAYGGPVILTPSTGLTAAVRAELQRLAPGQVFFVGLSDKVLGEVKAALPSLPTDKIKRLVGTDRYHTATLIADEVGKVVGVAKVALVPGDLFPDALSVAPIAANKGWPILLTPQKGPLPAVTSAKINALGVTSALVVGTNVKPPSTVTDVVSKVGVDRYQTSTLVAQYGKSIGLSYAHTGYVTGENYPDGLVAGPWLSKDAGLVLVSRPTTVPTYLQTLLLAAGDELTWMDFVGLPASGVSAIMDVAR